ncbi:hypothetical protein IQ07DRAFT_602984 [Pyrenochaeta sp. DS3sAY3a]|nr:hypothetical protein IQ07DRAFT_602984 [Pyrenochaeta sp. DS3sAY3a]
MGHLVHTDVQKLWRAAWEFRRRAGGLLFQNMEMDIKKLPKYVEYIAAQKDLRALAKSKREQEMDTKIVELEERIKRAKKAEEKWTAEAHDANNTLSTTQRGFEAELQAADGEEKGNSAKFREWVVGMKSYHKVIEHLISTKLTTAKRRAQVRQDSHYMPE